MAHGYWRRPDANEAVVHRRLVPHRRHRLPRRRRLLYLVDRAKDMIIRAGENVYCVEVENVLFDHPDVIDAAVVGVPHKALGEEVKAVVQVKRGLDGDRGRHPRRSAREHLANFKVPELRRDPRRAVAAQPGGQGAEEPAARRESRRSPPPTTRRCSRADRVACCSTSTASGAMSRSSPNGLAGIVRARRRGGGSSLRGTPGVDRDDRRRSRDHAAGAHRRDPRVESQDFEAPRFHMFYGFVAFITVGLAVLVQLRVEGRGWLEFSYGLGRPVPHGRRHPRHPAGRRLTPQVTRARLDGRRDAQRCA